MNVSRRYKMFKKFYFEHYPQTMFQLYITKIFVLQIFCAYMQRKKIIEL